MNTLDWFLMSHLARRPCSGYDLHMWVVNQGLWMGIRASMTSIYRSLAKMGDEGLLDVETSERDNAPDAKVYRLTPAGREALLEWARSPHVPSARPMDPDFGVKFNYAGQFGRDIAIDVVRRELEYRIAQKEMDGGAGMDVGTLDPIPELDSGWVEHIHTLSHARGYASTAAYIVWLELTLAQFEAADARERRHGDSRNPVPTDSSTSDESAAAR